MCLSVCARARPRLGRPCLKDEGRSKAFRESSSSYPRIYLRRRMRHTLAIRPRVSHGDPSIVQIDRVPVCWLESRSFVENNASGLNSWFGVSSIDRVSGVFRIVVLRSSSLSLLNQDVVPLDCDPMAALIFVCWSVCASILKCTTVSRIHIKLAVDERHG
jgi:hypothetical protein